MKHWKTGRELVNEVRRAQYQNVAFYPVFVISETGGHYLALLATRKSGLPKLWRSWARPVLLLKPDSVYLQVETEDEVHRRFPYRMGYIVASEKK